MKGFTLPNAAKYYTPVLTGTLSAGASATLEFRGPNNGEFGIKRILVGCTNPNEVLATATLNTEETIFSNVHLSVLQRLFLERSLRWPLRIAPNNTLKLTLTNQNGAQAHEYAVGLAGFDALGMKALRLWLRKRKLRMRTPVFLSAYTTLTANQDNKQVDVELRSYALSVVRLIMGSSTESDVRVSINVYNDEVKKKSFLTMINDEFSRFEAVPPIKLRPRDPLTLYVSNAGAGTPDFSVMAEAYRR